LLFGRKFERIYGRWAKPKPIKVARLFLAGSRSQLVCSGDASLGYRTAVFKPQSPTPPLQKNLSQASSRDTGNFHSRCFYLLVSASRLWILQPARQLDDSRPSVPWLSTQRSCQQ